MAHVPQLNRTSLCSAVSPLVRSRNMAQWLQVTSYCIVYSSYHKCQVDYNIMKYHVPTSVTN